MRNGNESSSSLCIANEIKRAWVEHHFHECELTDEEILLKYK